MLDFTELNKEYNSFWSSHSIENAKTQVRKVVSYVVSFTGVPPFRTEIDFIFEPTNLLALYAGVSNIEVSQAIDGATYKGLIEWFQLYLNDWISKIQDSYEKQKALEEKSILDDLLNFGSDVVQYGKTFLIIILIIVGIIFFINFNKLVRS